LASYLLAHSPFFARRGWASSMPSCTPAATPRYVVNRNDLVGRVPWINGVKTGHTSGAGYVLVGSGTRHGMTLLSAVLGTSSESTRDANNPRAVGLWLCQLPPRHPGAGRCRPRSPDGSRPTGRARGGDRRGHASSAWSGPRRELTLRVDVPRQPRGTVEAARPSSGMSSCSRTGGRSRGPSSCSRAGPLPAVSPLTLAARFIITRPFTLCGARLCCLGAVLGLVGVWRGRMRERSAAGPEAA